MVMPTIKSEFKRSSSWQLDHLDPVLVFVCMALLSLGLVMVASASVSIADRDYSNPFYYFQRQLVFIVIGLFAAAMVYRIRLVQWEKSGVALLGFALFLLVIVLIPGVGKTVNGSTRWISMGIINIQVSEVVKLFLLIYVAGYLVRHGEEVRTSLRGFIKPMLMVGLVGLLLLLEPDFGSTMVIMGTVLAMTFLGGVRFVQFISFMILFGASALMLIISSPYRMERLTSFMNPWADPFDTGFQLTQSLIAIGTGGWWGTGLGGSVQKLFYLPESHTDFLFAVLSEELGFVGVCFVIIMFAVLFFRIFKIGLQAERSGNRFAAYVAYGIGVWLALQAVINMGVNMGLMPTKGLTLPLMSYGGSSLVVCCMAIGLILRIHLECGEFSNQAVGRNSGRRKVIAAGGFA
ncbi:MAG: putative lipid II flippase FtsW [Gammaproteobacteria bacterium]|nr:putative lipid II flippase FtsW [Gammaproteobacteria bacterium]